MLLAEELLALRHRNKAEIEKALKTSKVIRYWGSATDTISPWIFQEVCIPSLPLISTRDPGYKKYDIKTPYIPLNWLLLSPCSRRMFIWLLRLSAVKEGYARTFSPSCNFLVIFVIGTWHKICVSFCLIPYRSQHSNKGWFSLNLIDRWEQPNKRFWDWEKDRDMQGRGTACLCAFER